MIRTRIQFEESQHRQIRKLAHQRRISISETVRRLVGRALRSGLEEETPHRAEELLKIAGIGRSGLEDLGRRHDDYLTEDFES